MNMNRSICYFILLFVVIGVTTVEGYGRYGSRGGYGGYGSRGGYGGYRGDMAAGLDKELKDGFEEFVESLHDLDALE
uniref:neuropeptide-like protein 28 n=1 Tax=Styela clava TaxID=7725 RepID=UPI00193ACE53|nr:neuropeptide-like protein 28 [Styela clava]